ncbi:hypothetical protein NIES2100_27310 [Calothrix sp. NIES-2100]|uniref:ArnT family glycosyltransferase n=1 Tax=Calothrix sp. NIES-2100 TaxID=1954172 RepID=UPI000B607089|nr:hypothetical protein NIES2100_27310 [Calothrix sp. NIES-2100]
MINLEKLERLLSIHEKLTIIIISVLGLVLRLYGINFGLPYIYDPDEPTFVIAAVKILASRDPNPHWFGHPASTEIYILVALYTIIFLIGKSLGIFVNAEAFKSLYFHDPTVFYLSGRLLSAVVGTAIIFLTYLIGRKIFNKNIGLMAAILMAIIPLHVHFSKLVRADLIMTFLILCGLWYCLKILENNSYINYIGVGFLTGLAIVTKYPSVVFTLTIILTYILSKGWQSKGGKFYLPVSLLACVTGAFLGSPFLFLDFQQVIANVTFESRATHLSATGGGFIYNLIWYLQFAVIKNFTFSGLLLAVFGFVICLASKQKHKWLLLSFPLFFLLFISSLNLIWERWIIPIVPFTCLIVAYAIYTIANWVERRLNPRLALWTILLLMVINCVPLSTLSIVQGREMSGVDTRTLAGRWMMSNIKSGSFVLMEAYTPQLPKRSFKFFEVNGGAIVEINPDSQKHEIFQPRLSSKIGEIKEVEDIRKKNIEYIVMSNMCDRFLLARDKYIDVVATCKKIMTSASLIYEIEKTPKVNQGPKIRIYKVQG